MESGKICLLMLPVREMVDSSALESYAKEDFNMAQMREVEMRLGFDLEFGEELERIYLLLEQVGQEVQSD